MGACSSKLSDEEKSRLLASKALEKKIRLEAKKDEEKVKLLLLGGGESGKSTIFKQMKIIYGKEFTKAEMTSQIPVIFLNVIQGIKLLANQIKTVIASFIVNNK